MKINKIVLDLDDTLASFTMTVLQALGCPVGPFDYDKFPVQHGYNIMAAWAELSGNHNPVTVPQFWSMVSAETWLSLPKSREFWLIDTAASLVGEENVLIATIPTKCEAAHAAKFSWIVNNCPKFMHRQYTIGPRKQWLAQEGVLLIDDSDKNCQDFQSNGGAALTVPRPWNCLHEKSSRASEYLSVELNKMF